MKKKHLFILSILPRYNEADRLTFYSGYLFLKDFGLARVYKVRAVARKHAVALAAVHDVPVELCEIEDRHDLSTVTIVETILPTPKRERMVG